MIITQDNADLFCKEAKATREKWEHMGITAGSCGISEQAYEECTVWSVLEQHGIERTEANIKRVLKSMGKEG